MSKKSETVRESRDSLHDKVNRVVFWEVDMVPRISTGGYSDG